MQDEYLSVLLLANAGAKANVLAAMQAKYIALVLARSTSGRVCCRVQVRQLLYALEVWY